MTLRNVFARKVRLALSAFAIVLGVAFVSGSSGECPSNPCVQQRAPAGASAAGPSDGGVGIGPA